MKNLKGFNGLVFFLLMITVRANASGAYTVIVALDGSGDYTSIQSAIDASKSFPDDRISILFLVLRLLFLTGVLFIAKAIHLSRQPVHLKERLLDMYFLIASLLPVRG
jgi:hypothetical protein